MTLKVQHKRSAVKGKAPLPADLEYGEIAVNYEATDPALYIKDSANAVRKIGTQPDATETVKGIVELATAAETTTGTDATRAVHPAGLKVELDKKATKTVTSDTAPANPADGDLWYDSVGGELYVWYDSDDAGAAVGTWVQASPQPTPKDDAVKRAGDTMTGALTLPAQVAGTRNNTAATMAMFADEFASSTAANGYQKLPSGLIVQWMNIANNNMHGAGFSQHTFPIAFPNAALSISLTGQTGGGSAYAFAGAAAVNSSLTPTQFQWIAYAAGAAIAATPPNTVGVFVIAIGH